MATLSNDALRELRERRAREVTFADATSVEELRYYVPLTVRERDALIHELKEQRHVLARLYRVARACAEESAPKDGS